MTLLEQVQSACVSSLACTALAGVALGALVCVAARLVSDWLRERRAQREFVAWLERHRAPSDAYRVRG